MVGKRKIYDEFEGTPLQRGKKRFKHKKRQEKLFNKGDRTIQSKTFRTKYPDKIRAYRVLELAIHKGEIIKPEYCEVCGDDGLIVGHHEDYSKPLNVKWLCLNCHNEIHKVGG